MSGTEPTPPQAFPAHHQVNSDKSGVHPDSATIMLNSFRAAILLLASLATATAQEPPSFEVAVIRPSAADATGTNFMLSSSRLSITNAPLTDLIQFAYNLKTTQQLPKTPAWITSQKFDVDATIATADMEALNKLPADQKLEQYRLRVRTLLADRFHFQASMQTKDLPAYALVLAKGGPKPALAPAPSSTLAQRTPTLGGFSRGQVKAGAVSMSVFADWLSGRPDVDGRPVVDATGLKGSFDFTLVFAPPGAQQAPYDATTPRATTGSDADVPLLTALEEQLGVKLEPRDAPVDVLVVDHVDPPSPN
jgi:uncharacterized protein (TIGR03435 family)